MIARHIFNLKEENGIRRIEEKKHTWVGHVVLA
jgi:hypothetical protein